MNKSLSRFFARTITQRGLYGIFFYNCMKSANNSRVAPAVTMRVRVAQYNVDSAGHKNYASLGDRPLGSVYLLFCIYFVGLVVAWLRQMTGKSPNAKRVHHIVLILLLVEAATFMIETFRQFRFAATGDRKEWDRFSYQVLALKGIRLAYAAAVLLGLGPMWSSAKAFLSDNDKIVLMCVLPLQVGVNVVIAVLGATSEDAWWWGQLLDVLRFVDVMCVLALLLPLVWSMRNLREAAEREPLHEAKAALALQRVRVFRAFYMVVIVYIYVTRVALRLAAESVPFDMAWVSKLRELCAALLYMCICYAFKPGSACNPYEGLTRATRRTRMSWETLAVTLTSSR